MRLLVDVVLSHARRKKRRGRHRTHSQANGLLQKRQWERTWTGELKLTDRETGDARGCRNKVRTKGETRRVAHIGSKVRTNPPSFAKFRFFFLVRFTSAPCLVITRRLCSSNKEFWSNATSTVNVCTIVVRWASPGPRLR